MNELLKWTLISLGTYTFIMCLITYIRYKKRPNKSVTFLSWLTFRVNDIAFDITMRGIKRKEKLIEKRKKKEQKIKSFFLKKKAK